MPLHTCNMAFFDVITGFKGGASKVNSVHHSLSAHFHS